MTYHEYTSEQRESIVQQARSLYPRLVDYLETKMTDLHTGVIRLMAHPDARPDLDMMRRTLAVAIREKRRADEDEYAGSRLRTGFYMESWVAPHGGRSQSYVTVTGGDTPFDCGTAACLAGTAAILAVPVGETVTLRNIELSGGSWIGAGRRALGLNERESREGTRDLFHMTDASIEVLVEAASWLCGHDYTPLLDASTEELLVLSRPTAPTTDEPNPSPF